MLVSHTTLPAGPRVGETRCICPVGDGPGLAWSAAWLRTNEQSCCGHQDLLEHLGSYSHDSTSMGIFRDILPPGDSPIPGSWKAFVQQLQYRLCPAPR